jgi:hypothetical protein
MRKLIAGASAVLVTLALVAGVVITRGVSAAPKGPTVSGNVLVDQDHHLPFSQNKQNEPAITRDPTTGTLIAGANDEIGQPLCTTPTTPLTSPCPFAPGVPTSAYYRSTDNGQTWSGAYLPGFETIGRVSGGDPSLDYGPARCASGAFSFSCGTVIYYASLADPFPTFGGEQVTVSRSHDDGATWSNPVQATNTDNKSNFDDHEWIAVDHFPSSPHFGQAYLFWAVFCNTCSGNGNVKLYVASSHDEGRSWTPGVQVSAANNNTPQGFRETGQVAVSSTGIVEAFWTESADVVVTLAACVEPEVRWTRRASCRANGIRQFYLEAGAGPPVIFCPSALRGMLLNDGIRHDQQHQPYKTPADDQHI